MLIWLKCQYDYVDTLSKIYFITYNSLDFDSSHNNDSPINVKLLTYKVVFISWY